MIQVLNYLVLISCTSFPILVSKSHNVCTECVTEGMTTVLLYLLRYTLIEMHFISLELNPWVRFVFGGTRSWVRVPMWWSFQLT
jgi:hypothetical protein